MICDVPWYALVLPCLSDTEDIQATGFAWSGIGRGINRVDVSIDGGETWETVQYIKGYVIPNPGLIYLRTLSVH